MKINKALKHVSFEWDDELKTFTITEEDGNRVILNKVYAFAFLRFVIRMAQRNWFKKILKKSPPPNPSAPESAQFVFDERLIEEAEIEIFDHEIQ